MCALGQLQYYKQAEKRKKYWIGHKVRSGFSIIRKIDKMLWKNCLAKPMYLFFQI